MIKSHKPKKDFKIHIETGDGADIAEIKELLEKNGFTEDRVSFSSGKSEDIGDMDDFDDSGSGRADEPGSGLYEAPDHYFECPYCGSGNTDGNHCFDCGEDF